MINLLGSNAAFMNKLLKRIPTKGVQDIYPVPHQKCPKLPVNATHGLFVLYKALSLAREPYPKKSLGKLCLYLNSHSEFGRTGNLHACTKELYGI